MNKNRFVLLLTWRKIIYNRLSIRNIGGIDMAKIKEMILGIGILSAVGVYNFI